MAEGFEKLIVWQKGHALKLLIHREVVPLLPAAESFHRAVISGVSVTGALQTASAAAADGAAATARMLPRRGRSGYLGERALGHPDPGAEAVAAWLAALIPC